MPLFRASDYFIIAFFMAMILLLMMMPSYRIPMSAALGIFVVLYMITGLVEKSLINFELTEKF